MTAEGVHHAGVEAFERLENAHAGSELNPRCAPLAQENLRRSHGREKVTHPGHGQRRRRDLDSLRQDVRHEGSLQLSVVSCQSPPLSAAQCQALTTDH